MKILFLTNSLRVGGVETNLLVLARELSDLGHEIWVASAGGPLETELARSSARQIKMSVSLYRPIQLIGSAWAIRRLATRQGFDVIHALSAAGNMATQLVPRGGASAPLIVSSPMGLQNSDREPAFVTTLRNRLLVLRAKRVLLISEEIAAAVTALGLPGDRLIRCDVVGIDLTRFKSDPTSRTATRGSLGISEAAQVVTTIGALHPRKSHHLFLQAVARLRMKHPALRALVVGGGPELRHLREQSARLGLGDAVLFTGPRRDVASLLAATDVYVKPGVVEGFVGITVLEAMATGIPVVAFDTRDVRAAIAPDVTGLLVPRADVAALANAIEHLLNDPQGGRALADAAHQHVVARFGIERVASNLAELYGRLRSTPSGFPTDHR